MIDQKREPHADNDILADEPPTPSHSGSSGGVLSQEIGALDDEKVATGADPQPTSVHKGSKPAHGADAHLPNRQQTHDRPDKAPPRRTR